MLMLNKNEPNEYHVIRDINDFLFINFTRPSRQSDLLLNIGLVFAPFIAQMMVWNEPDHPKYTESREAIWIRFLNSLIITG